MSKESKHHWGYLQIILSFRQGQKDNIVWCVQWLFIVLCSGDFCFKDFLFWKIKCNAGHTNIFYIFKWFKKFFAKVLHAGQFKHEAFGIRFLNDNCYFAFLLKVRVDSGIQEGSDISIYYDPMISKVIE